MHSEIKYFAENITVKYKPRCGRPTKITDYDHRFIVRSVKVDPKISAPEIAAAVERRIGKEFQPSHCSKCI